MSSFITMSSSSTNNVNTKTYHHELSSLCVVANEDDGSVHSTVTVYSPATACRERHHQQGQVDAPPVAAPLPTNSSSSRSNSKKSNNKIRHHDHAGAAIAVVHFNENNNEYYENHIVCRQDVQELCWYTRFETRAFRKAANAMARNVADVERGPEQPVDIAVPPYSSSHAGEEDYYDDSCSSSYKTILQRTFQACLDSTTSSFEEMPAGLEEVLHGNNFTSSSILTDQDHATLCRRMSDFPERLGLERLAIRKLGDDRFTRRKTICKVLLDLQKRSLVLLSSRSDDDEENNNKNQHRHDAASQKAEMFRACCQAVSRPSRLFARELACACLGDEGVQ
jgi:hypothetical protein